MWNDDDDDEEIKDRPLMVIPLPLHMYRTCGVGELAQRGRWGSDKNTIGYRLEEVFVPLVEGDQVPGRLNRAYGIDYVNGKGVCIIVPDHSFGRGLVRLLLGWEIIVTIPDADANDFERTLRTQGRGQYVRSRLHNAPMTAFSLESDQDLELAVAAKMTLDGVSIVRSKLPLL